MYHVYYQFYLPAVIMSISQNSLVSFPIQPGFPGIVSSFIAEGGYYETSVTLGLTPLWVVPVPIKSLSVRS